MAEQKLTRTMEELERSNRELEQFAYVASHDLREPLRMVASYVKLLEKKYGGKLDQTAREFIWYAVDGADRMARLIDDLLTFSRVGTHGKQPVPTDAEAVFQVVQRNLQVAVQEKSARLTHDPLPAVMADENQLVQLLQNLCANALKFCKDRTPQVHVGVKRVDGMYVFSVRDNGIGIAPQHQQRIFQIFQQLHSHDEYEGTGIGLAVCKRIVERHGGKLWVESQVGEGATFYFTLAGAEGNDG
jgi:light-regulated signal transduction histidine kinase (bacteriophytochrome)